MSTDLRPHLDLNVPVSPGIYVAMSVPRPMTHTEWIRMLDVLDAMKPGIVGDERAVTDVD